MVETRRGAMRQVPGTEDKVRRCADGARAGVEGAGAGGERAGASGEDSRTKSFR
jgi:hypothetical protein